MMYLRQIIMLYTLNLFMLYVNYISIKLEEKNNKDVLPSYIYTKSLWDCLWASSWSCQPSIASNFKILVSPQNQSNGLHKWKKSDTKNHILHDTTHMR